MQLSCIHANNKMVFLTRFFPDPLIGYLFTISRLVNLLSPML